MSNSFWSHGLQHARLPCPSPTPGACSNSCPSSQWCHPTISSSVVPFSSCLQSFPASGSFPVSQFFSSGGQSSRASASASVLPVNTQDFRIDWFDLFAVQGTLLQHYSLKHSHSCWFKCDGPQNNREAECLLPQRDQSWGDGASPPIITVIKTNQADWPI